MKAAVAIAACVGLGALYVETTHACCDKVQATRNNVATVRDCLRVYFVKHAHYPTSLDVLVTDGVIDRAPFDAWGNALAYSVDGSHPVVTSRGWGERPDISSNDL